jgi:hypothetical protein
MARRSNNGRNTRRQGGARSTTRGELAAQSAVLNRIEENTRMATEKAPPNTRDKLPMQLSNKKVYTFKRSTIGTGISASTSGSTFGAASYYLASFDSTSEIAENYQEYRIIELTVKFIPVATLVNALSDASQGIADLGHFHTAIDVHNDNVPISMAELEEYKTHQVVRSGQYVARTWTPRTLGRCYGGVTDAFYCMPAGTWLSTDYNDGAYYGIKWALSQAVGIDTGSTIYTTQVDAVIQCRNTL